jgi:hypothetical protein
MQELQQTHQNEGISRFTVNKSDEPLVFVEVIRQELHERDGEARGSVGGVEYVKPYRKDEASTVSLSFASGGRRLVLNDFPSRDQYSDQYLIWLAIDGAGAEGTKKFVLRRNQLGQYDMTEAWPQWVTQ